MFRVLDSGAGGGDLGGGDVAAEDVVGPEVEELGGAVAGEGAERDAEDGVELLERLLLGLGHEEEHEEEAGHVPGRVPREGPRRRPGLHQRRPGERDDGVEEPGRCCC